MSVKRSEGYLYFQNKAIHYHKVRTARPLINDQPPSSLRNTIDHVRHNRDLPYDRSFEIDFENKHLTNRIMNIIAATRK
jgi:hypothetical protein